MDAVDRVSRAAGFQLSRSAAEGLRLYFRELASWNRSINLTGIKELDQMVEKHLGDTLLLLRHMPEGTGSVMDVGTGSGVPGLILKILEPKLSMTLVESVKKKCSFLRYVISRLGLFEVHVEQIRLSPDNPPASLPEGGYDLVVSQAAGSLTWLLEIAAPFLSENGCIVALKGPEIDHELSELKKKANSAVKCGLDVEVKRDKLPLTGADRSLVFIRPRKGRDR